MVYLTRKEHFNAAHKLYNTNWTKEKNEAVFGPCANENWHGHNYDLFITVKGKPNAETGFVYDAKKLGELIREFVVKHLDHKNLNLDVPFLKDKLCSTENVAIEIWNILVDKLPNDVKLHCVKLQETTKIYVEYFGE